MTNAQKAVHRNIALHPHPLHQPAVWSFIQESLILCIRSFAMS